LSPVLRLARGSPAYVAMPLAAAAVLTIFGSLWAAALFLLISVFMLYFHRDPDRSPAGEGMISPADGRVLKAIPGHISIFMSLRDVHVNRSPLDGVVKSLQFRPGRHRPAFSLTDGNEQNTIEIESQDGTLLLRQIAGILARTVICYVSPGDRVGRGERIGMIRFGSRVEVTVPPGYLISVRPGDRVRAGETVIAVNRP